MYNYYVIRLSVNCLIELTVKQQMTRTAAASTGQQMVRVGSAWLGLARPGLQIIITKLRPTY